MTDEGVTAEESLGVESCVRAFPKNELKLDYCYNEKIGPRSMNVLSESASLAKGKKKGCELTCLTKSRVRAGGTQFHTPVLLCGSLSTGCGPSCRSIGLSFEHVRHGSARRKRVRCECSGM